ncbi:hypothetical protein AVEN_51807-1 [Araneus ventricosus]|uniref:Uncharacterized protein n=1 Tax=Araneus ventricosus TaxID=182803 RepID=A0A4Y2LLL9_ARAVE|nr:hypothetical protein AVEN_51807-1 [Araneus ventricosus]
MVMILEYESRTDIMLLMEEPKKLCEENVKNITDKNNEDNQAKMNASDPDFLTCNFEEQKSIATHAVARASPISGIFRTAISEISSSDQITSFAKLRRQPDTKSEEESWEKEQQIGNWEEILPFRTHARLQEMGRSKTNSGAGQQILPPALQMLQGNVPRQRGETLAGAAVVYLENDINTWLLFLAVKQEANGAARASHLVLLPRLPSKDGKENHEAYGVGECRKEARTDSWVPHYWHDRFT